LLTYLFAADGIDSAQVHVLQLKDERVWRHLQQSNPIPNRLGWAGPPYSLRQQDPQHGAYSIHSTASTAWHMQQRICNNPIQFRIGCH
jgi:hypothetical protein